MRIFIWIALSGFLPAKSQHNLVSPDGNTIIQIQTRGNIQFSVSRKNNTIVREALIGLGVKNFTASPLTLRSVKKSSVNDTIVNPVPERRKIIRDQYNQLRIDFKEPFSIEFRAYNDGLAYRWITRFRDSVIIENERAEIHFDRSASVIYPEVEKRPDCDSFHTSFEDPYKTSLIPQITETQLIYSPLLVQLPTGSSVLLTESDLEEYPGIFFRGTTSTALRAVFAPFPAEEIIKEGEFPQAIVSKREPYIARVQGSRNYPWRVMIITDEDRELASSDMVYRLASPSRITDYSWIRPGQGTDEWITGISLFNVPFKAGINTSTYKYYIDFAQRFGFERIMLDAGWSDYKDLFRINPALDMEELASYAKSKGVKLSMWTLAMTLDKQLDSALEQFNRWGVDFIMTDFMDRDDQQMVRFYHRIAAACAGKKIMIMYHGAFKTAGFNRTWPNSVTREGVLGSEYNIWSEKATPEHNVLLPFIRMAAGPMDYEPGLLDNATKETFRPIGGKVMSQGTRCHQLAMFLVYESPIQIFSGNPSQGFLEPDFMELMGSIPTTWDETIVLDGKAGDFIITARKKGADWFIGGMTDWSERTISFRLDFLDDKQYAITICRDGINADKYASDYLLEKKTAVRSDQINLTMARGGGFLIRLSPAGK